MFASRTIPLSFIAVAIALVSGDEKCCAGDCPTKKEQKFYSISDDQMTCAEACFPTDELGIYLQIDPNLETAGTIHPCSGHGYESYIDTVTLDGAEGVVKLTEDLYSHGDPNKAAISSVFTMLNISYFPANSKCDSSASSPQPTDVIELNRCYDGYMYECDYTGTSITYTNYGQVDCYSSYPKAYGLFGEMCLSPANGYSKYDTFFHCY